jgi:hypothetical protein
MDTNTKDSIQSFSQFLSNKIEKILAWLIQNRENDETYMQRKRFQKEFENEFE